MNNLERSAGAGNDYRDSQFTKYAMQVFSSRLPPDRAPNRFSQALARARTKGPLIDLTAANPTVAGFAYPLDLLESLADPGGLVYRPSPLGLADARAAAAATFARRGLNIEADRIVLTASTSEAYSILFKLLCDPGGSRVLTPVPSYPLFDHLTALDGVEQARYALAYHGAWTIDLPSLDAAWTPATRAVLCVTPNNPTGSALHAGDADELVTRCAARGAALILDEVFCDYGLRGDLEEPTSLCLPDALTFRLGGLSKTIGLPQVKLGWLAVQGPDAQVAEALDRLAFISDTYLSVSTPVQLALPRLLDRGGAVRAQILDRVRRNYAALRDIVAHPGASVLAADGGWSGVLRVPATRSEESLALDLLERDAVVVHPGFFFDFPHEAFLVVSLLPRPEEFARGARLIEERLHAA
jgi:aspartate/methionine/tyrosine aminotransferase